MCKDHDKVIEHYAKGFSLRETGRRFGLSIEGVRHILQRHAPHLIRKPYDTRQNSTGLSSGQRVL
jgi:hypothetical protein